jgi:trimeric autotransporter adhesin
VELIFSEHIVMNKILFFLFFIASAMVLKAQNVAINNTGVVANASAILDASSSNKGLLIPRMSKAQKNAITAPATGLLVYQNAPDSIGFQYYDGAKWLWLATSNSIDSIAWKTTGNVGTNTTTSFIGTKDNVPVSFRQNDKWIGRLDATNKNYFIGGNAGFNAIGVNNVAIGDSAFGNTTTAAAYSNIAIGSKALFSNQTAHNVVAIGDSALLLSRWNNTVASENTAVGSKALMSSITGGGNTAVGYHALLNSISDGNTAVGSKSLFGLINGVSNTAFGSRALAYGESGDFNTAIGAGAGSFINANLNTYVGYFAGSFNTLGSNTAVGANTMQNNTTGTKITVLGVGANVSNSPAITNATAIGANSFVSQSNSLVLGSIIGISGASASTNVGIGTTAPLTSLDVRGGIRTMYSGTVIRQVEPGLQILPLPISPAVPVGWDFTNTMVIVSIVDGTTGTIYQTKLVASNQINLDMNGNFAGPTRFNYIIFKL